MMDDLQDQLVDTFERHTTEPRQLEQLLATATRRGGALRRRRRLAGAGTAVAAAIVVAALVLPQLGSRTAPAPTPASASRLAAPDPRAASDPTIVPSPPIAVGAVTATEDPTMVGRDPRLIHVGLARIPTGYRGADWSSDSGYGERISLVDQTGDERSGSIFVGRREAGLNGGIGANGPLHRVRGTTVHGHRASVLLATVPARPGQDAEQYWYVRWQERPGLWAQICGSRYSTAERLATAAQFDTDSGANRP
jgi:hypothetical protein